ncbi:MAG: ABC-F family ATP-binding cassette domain-containing protein [Deltaproteobacteria bacterium]|nr:ABC-F family ATP-binding cassette domain-containing protein [Deltaproteobacteria bacterium]
MMLLACDALTFGYHGETLFEDVSFTVSDGERIAIVAPNGSGKTTLLKLLAGALVPDSGRVIVSKGVRVGYLRQSHEPDAKGTVMDALLGAFDEVVGVRHELHAALAGAASGEPDALDRLSRAQDAYHRVGGDALERRVGMLAETVGFRASDMERPVASLSGGERGRLALGCVLAADPDLLLLDEPTSHLDLETTERLEKMLASFRGGAVVVSHDRAFLDAVAPLTLELGQRQARLYHAPYSQYLVEREEVMARENARAERQQSQIAKTEDFIRRNLAGQKTKQAQSRRKMLEKVDRLDRAEDVWLGAGRIAIRFADAPRSGDIVLDAKQLGATRGGRVLFDGVDLLLRRGERVGVVGPNGSGKSTLLKMLAGDRQPDDRGEVRRGSNVVIGYFDQHLEAVRSDRSCVDEIRSQRPDMVVDAVRQYLARFRLFGDDVFRGVGSLSGGERTRLALAKMLLVPRNLLLFDEPTNHLDIPATEILEQALAKFDGSAVLVSHDRYFLDNVCTRTLHLDAAGATFYPGNFSAYRASRSNAATAASVGDTPAAVPAAGVRGGSKGDRPPKKSEAPPAAVSAPAQTAAAPGKAAYEEQRRRQRDQEKRKRRIAELEQMIASAEEEVAHLRAKLAAMASGDWAKTMRMAEQERAITGKLERLVEEWTNLAEETDG